MMVLERPVLVLNKNWKAIGTISVQDAIVKLFSEYKDGSPKAKIIEPETYSQLTWNDWSKLVPDETEDCIRTGNAIFKIPEIILLTRYEKLPRIKHGFNRKTLYKRDNNQCQYCLRRKPIEELSVDHIIPRSRGGLTSWDNCVISCIECNSRKSNRTPDEAGMFLHTIPQKPQLELLNANFMKKASWSVFV